MSSLKLHPAKLGKVQSRNVRERRETGYNMSDLRVRPQRKRGC